MLIETTKENGKKVKII